MKKITTATELMNYMENNFGHYGLRGLSQRNIEANYNEGDYMESSLNLEDSRDCDFDAEANELNGTSAIGINEMMWEDELESLYVYAKGYANNHHNTNVVMLISGESEDYGEDENEVILNNNNINGCFGGKVVAIVEL